jgi:transcriptional regulator with XRE-family HTH domain
MMERRVLIEAWLTGLAACGMIPVAISGPGGGDGMVQLGQRIRERRLELGLSLRELAGRAGFSTSFLSQVERDVTSPSIDSLHRISQALEVPVFHFLIEPETESPVVRRDERVQITWPQAGSELTFRLLTPSGARKLEAFLTEWEPGKGRPGRGFGAQTEEFVYVLQGQLEVQLGDDVYLLGPGDTISFEGLRVKRMEPRGDQTVRLISVITPPVF